MTEKVGNGLGKSLAVAAFSFFFLSSPAHSEDLRKALLNGVSPFSAKIDSFAFAMRDRIQNVVTNMTTGERPILSPIWSERIAEFLESGEVRPLRSNAAAVRIRRGTEQNKIDFDLPQTFLETWSCEREETEVAHEILHIVQTESDQARDGSLENLTWMKPLENAAALAEVRYFSDQCTSPAADTELASLSNAFRQGNQKRLTGLFQARVPDRATAEKLTALSLSDGKVVLESFRKIVGLMNDTVANAEQARKPSDLVRVFQEIRAYQRYLPPRMNTVLSRGIRSREDFEHRGILSAGGANEIQSSLRPRYNRAVTEIWKVRKAIWAELENSI